MAARITRAKKRIVGAGIPFAVPDAGALPDRLDTVAQTAYLAFTAGYSPGSGPDLLRADLAGEAVRLARTVLGLRPDEPVLLGLLALVLLQHSRRDARVVDGQLVLLADQDRRRWHVGEVEEAVRLLAHPALRGPVTVQAASYTLQARIAAEHALSPSAEETRWDRIVGLYDVLLGVAPTPSARLARAVAVAEDRGPAAGLAALEGVEVPQSHRPAAVRAELLARAGDTVAARAAYDQAIAACGNEVERAHLEARRQSLG
jgi:RNA polymerase sigma-70 factor (ECF subfamily)